MKKSVSKKRIAICSILKPVTEPRAYEKFARSLAKGNKYEINIIGFDSEKIPSSANLIFHPLFKGNYKTALRLFGPLKLWFKLLQVKPHIIICNSPEILVVILLNKIIFGSKILYDIQEDHYKNIRCRRYGIKLGRQLLAYLVRAWERLFFGSLDHVFLAEKIYADEISLKGCPHSVLENNYVPLGLDSVNFKVESTTPFLLLCGTLSHEFGLFDSIELAARLRSNNPKLKLLIIGHIPQKRDKQRFRQVLEVHDFIIDHASEKPVDHYKIISAIQDSLAVMALYQPIDCINGKSPSTIYEAIHLKKPVLVNCETEFGFTKEIQNLFITIDLNDTDPAKVLARIYDFEKGDVLRSQLPDWTEKEEKVLLEKIDSVNVK